MAVNQGLSSLVDSSPNFSNQGVENSVNDIKSVDKDDGYSWIKSSIDVDTAIEDNTVLTASQKNDLKDTINNQSYLNIGRYLNDLIKHTANILNGSLVYIANPDVEEAATFLETLNLVHSLQSTIPNLYGVIAEEKNRGVDDHFGTLRGILTKTEDSSKPVVTSLKDTLSFLDARARTTSSLATATAAVRYSNTQLITFLASVVADSTDFQQTLNTYGSQLAGNMTNLHNQLANEPLLTKRTQLIADRNAMNTQVSLENSNLANIRTYTSNLVDNIGYTSLAEDTKLNNLMAKASQTPAWIDYFENYKTRQDKLNPIYSNISTDSDKEGIINQVLKAKGLPDVLDYVNLEAVAKKAKRDFRIDTAGFDRKTTEQVITASCNQLGITTANRSIYNQSKVLLNSMNKNDRLIVANALDDNEITGTIS